jgi:hypothetical protein
VDCTHYPGCCHVNDCLILLWQILELGWSSLGLGYWGGLGVGVGRVDLLNSGAELGGSLFGVLLVQSVPLCVDLRASVWSGSYLGSWHLLGRKFGCRSDLPRRLDFGCRPGSGSGDVDEV